MSKLKIYEAQILEKYAIVVPMFIVLHTLCSVPN